jgi:hypothetical protein
MKDLNAGRHIATTIITRLPVRAADTRLLGSKLRILEGRIDVNGYDLAIIASHWTSQLTDEEGEKRERYAETIYDEYRRLSAREPAVNLLICGDFNDTPDVPSVTQYLRAIGDRSQVIPWAMPPVLLNLMAGKDPNCFGTLYHKQLLIYDQIVVFPGLLDDAGWTCARTRSRLSTH